MTTPKEVGFRWFNEVWGNRRTDAIYELMAPEGVGHLEGGVEIQGPAQFAEYQQALLGAMSDMKMEIVNAIEEGEYVCLYWSGSGTHTGGGMGIAPTGRSISCRGTTWLRVVDGVIVEGWDFWNQGQLMATLTAPAEATA